MSRLAAHTGMKRCGMKLFGLKLFTACVGLAGLAGCADSDSHSSSNISNRQDDAVKDPFSYGPSEGKTTTPNEPTLSKHDDSLKGEWQRAWNP